MSGAGRPLRFLILVFSGWIGARVVMLWPVSAVEHAIMPSAMADPVVAGTKPTVSLPAWSKAVPILPKSPVLVPLPMQPSPLVFSVAEPPPATAVQRTVSNALPDNAPQGIVAGLPSAAPPSPEKERSRFFGSAWGVVRGGNGSVGGIAGAQLGGAQAGLRIAYALTRNRRLAIAAHASSPLGAGMREVALSVEWQPTRLPIRLIAEQRFALNQGKGGPTLMAVGGIGPLPIAAGFQLEGYAQGGVIARDGAEGFADGALRIARPVAAIGKVRIDLGAGSWGAAQRGARRLDIGPSLSAQVPVAGQNVRLSLDWRQRVAGNAAPGSGLAVTLGADF